MNAIYFQCFVDTWSFTAIKRNVNDLGFHHFVLRTLRRSFTHEIQSQPETRQHIKCNISIMLAGITKLPRCERWQIVWNKTANAADALTTSQHDCFRCSCVQHLKSFWLKPCKTWRYHRAHQAAKLNFIPKLVHYNCDSDMKPCRFLSTVFELWFA